MLKKQKRGKKQKQKSYSSIYNQFDSQIFTLIKA